MLYRDIFVVRRVNRLKHKLENGKGDAGTAAKSSHDTYG